MKTKLLKLAAWLNKHTLSVKEEDHLVMAFKREGSVLGNPRLIFMSEHSLQVYLDDSDHVHHFPPIMMEVGDGILYLYHDRIKDVWYGKIKNYVPMSGVLDHLLSHLESYIHMCVHQSYGRLQA